jgi:hypothetical protein
LLEASAPQLCQRNYCGFLAVPLRDHDIGEGGAAVVHRFVEGATQVLRVLDKEALAAEGLIILS